MRDVSHWSWSTPNFKLFLPRPLWSGQCWPISTVNLDILPSLGCRSAALTA